MNHRSSLPLARLRPLAALLLCFPVAASFNALAQAQEEALESVKDTKFSVDRGYHEAPISLEITTGTDGASIYYTTDGSEPSLGTLFRGPNGRLYEGPIAINSTTVLRAKAFKVGLNPSNTDTQSYLFLSDILRQPKAPENAPEKWGHRTPDYEMDPRVVNDPAYLEEITLGFKSIRTLSLVVDPDDFFSVNEGIYANPQNDGREWEREVSFEYIHPDGSRGAQVNGGIRIHGNGSRSADGQPKHGFRVEFRGEYGSARLNYPLFPDTLVEKFDSIILRAQNAHGWTRSSQISNPAGTEREQSQYIRDSYARDLMKAMGHIAGEATYVHLFINGLYWGLYNPVEYPRTYFGQSYFGGVEEDYDVINRRTTTTKIIDGTFDAWDAMQDLANSGLETPEKYAAIQKHINVDNLIDYMLMHQYMGSRDGPEVFNSNNMRAIRKTRGETTTTWIGLPWDMEASMFEIDVTRNIDVDDPNTLVRVYTKLRDNPEFLLRYGDHVHRHFFNDGVLTPTRSAAIWERRAKEIETAIIAESARWGDYRRSGQPFTRDVEWTAERNRLLETYFPTRTEFLLKELRNKGLYPETKAPAFNQHGNTVPPGFILIMEAGTLFSPQKGIFYYTTDGSDPRMPGGAIAPSAMPFEKSGVPIDSSMLVRARTHNEGRWSALNEAFFYVNSVPANAENLVISEIMYHPEKEAEAEYIELYNRSDDTVNLRDVYLDRVEAQGVRFDFSESPIQELSPNSVLLVVQNAAAFEGVYGSGLPVAGQWSGGALNNAGEGILLKREHAIPSLIRYHDRDPWPSQADGEGHSLVRSEDLRLGWTSAAPSPGRHEGDPSLTRRDPVFSKITRLIDGKIRLEWMASAGSSDRIEFSSDLRTWQLRSEITDPGRFEEVPPGEKGYYRMVREAE